jgi:hypothetical protein
MLSWLDRNAECFGITRVQAAAATGLLTEFGRKALSQMAIGIPEDVAARAASCTGLSPAVVKTTTVADYPLVRGSPE